MVPMKNVLKCAFFLAALFSASASLAAVQDGAPVKVAVLPFAIHAPGNMTYLQDSVRDMLASRLAWKDKVQVIDRAATDQALKGVKGASSGPDALRIGGALHADYVLYGSVTSVGQSVSIDAWMAPVGGGSEPLSLTESGSLDTIVPRINKLAQNISEKLFGRPAEKAEAVPEADAQASTRNPESLIPDAMTNPDKTSALNPNFVEVTPSSALNKAGVWRSQDIMENILAMDVGAIAGDGRMQIVTASSNKITVYQKEPNGLRAIAVYSAGPLDSFAYVATADLNHDGKDKIIVTCLQKHNDPRLNGPEAKEESDTTILPSSFVLAMKNNKLEMISNRVPYFLNAVSFGSQGKVFMGQKRDSHGGFASGISEMGLKDSKIAEFAPVSVPDICNVYNFVKADLAPDKTDKIILVDNSQMLSVCDSAGSVMTKSNKRFAATSNAIPGKVEDLRFNMIDFIYVPSPILVTSLNKEKIPEIIANQNTSEADLSPEQKRSYTVGGIVSLSWNQYGLVENWKSRELAGMVSSLRITDFDKSGPKLVVCMVANTDFFNTQSIKSVILTFDLNVAGANKPAKAE